MIQKNLSLIHTLVCTHTQTHKHTCIGINPGTVYLHLGLNRVISGMSNHQLSVTRGAERRSPRFSLTTLLLRPHALSACVCSRCRLADCCDSSDSVTNQIEEHWRDVPTLFLQRGWTGEQWALPSGGVSGGWDKCVADFLSTTRARLQFRRAYKCLPGEGEAARIYVSVCVLEEAGEYWPEATVMDLLHFTQNT